MVGGMALYTGRQLLLLFALLVAAGAGLAIREWRASHPELADRLERLDRQADVPTRGTGDTSGSPASERPKPEKPERPERRPAPPERRPVDLNSATQHELARLPGVGPSLAVRIVERRESVGAFASVEDLRRVKGIGPAKLGRLRQLVTVVQ
jgi:competence protein ComEA